MEAKKLKVEIYYETLCPDSMRFIRNQLYGAMVDNSLLQFSDLIFIPYGKVGVSFFVQTPQHYIKAILINNIV